jgi:large subunit ribosomal protein L15
MSLQSLSNVPGARHRTKRLGCGEASGHGKTSGRGNKGQYSRSGHKRKATFEGGQMRLVRRIPKRGFNNAAHRLVLLPVNVAALAQFENGTEVTEATLRAAGLVKGEADGVKILGEGDLARKLTVKAHGFSASARSKIEGAGGACVVVE